MWNIIISIIIYFLNKNIGVKELQHVGYWVSEWMSIYYKIRWYVFWWVLILI